LRASLKKFNLIQCFVKTLGGFEINNITAWFSGDAKGEMLGTAPSLGAVSA
jgi:hypothetical protein